MMARLPESDLAALSTGVPAQVTPVGSVKTYAGSIWQVSPVIDPASRQGVARIAVPYDRDLRPGGFATANIRAGSTDAPMLPESAVLNDSQGTYVYIVDKDNAVRRRPVKVGAVTDSGVVVAEGLNGTERVVLSAGPFLTEGEKIRPQRAVAAR
jgi:RND family efflux transporter MFP subunit